MKQQITHHQHSKVTMVAAVDSGGASAGAGYVAALCPPATVSIQQVKIPVGCSGIYTQCEVPESDGNGVHAAPPAAPICKKGSAFRGGCAGAMAQLCAQTPAQHKWRTQLSVTSNRAFPHSSESGRGCVMRFCSQGFLSRTNAQAHVAHK